jgi:hypothetical protein
LLELLDEFVQLLEPLFPDHPIAIEPVVKLLQSVCPQLVEALLRMRLDTNKPRPVRQLNCRRNGRQEK